MAGFVVVVSADGARVEAGIACAVDGRSWAVFDGRFDDREALVRRLERRTNRKWPQATDVELLLLAYEIWGIDCIDVLLGDFAFCIWDADHRRLFCARDHFGVKPLYYARVGTAVVVSNVLRALRQYPGVSSRFDDEAIGDFLLFGACLEPARTSFADIARVPPAHTLTCAWSDSTPRIARYWALEPVDALRLNDPNEYVCGYHRTLFTVVQDRVRDEPVGVLMSGGLDSSSVAMAAVRRKSPPNLIRAYTAVYDSVAEERERHYSTLVAESLGIPIEHCPMDGYGWFDRWNEDLLPPEPSTEPMTAMMADMLDAASGHGAAVLTGDGGDPALLPSTVTSQLRRVPLDVIARGFWQSIRDTGTLPPLGLRSGLRRWWSPDVTVPSWLADSFARHLDPVARINEISRRRAPAEGHRGAALSALIDPWWTSMFETYDAGATRRPVEVRYPLFDVRFVTYALSLPTYPWCVNKTIARAAMRDRLPKEIWTRPKSPLPVDFQHVHGQWTKTRVEETIESAPELAHYVDMKKFRAVVRPEGLLTEDEPGTLAAVALATWLRCAEVARV